MSKLARFAASCCSIVPDTGETEEGLEIGVITDELLDNGVEEGDELPRFEGGDCRFLEIRKSQVYLRLKWVQAEEEGGE